MKGQTQVTVTVALRTRVANKSHLSCLPYSVGTAAHSYTLRKILRLPYALCERVLQLISDV